MGTLHSFMQTHTHNIHSYIIIRSAQQKEVKYSVTTIVRESKDLHLGNDSAIFFNFLSCNISTGSNVILRANVEEAIITHLENHMLKI